jgi:hypothetical protein
MLYSLRAEENLSEVAAMERSDQPIENGEAAHLEEMAGRMPGKRTLPID